MCVKCCAIGVFERGGVVSADRRRVSGVLSRGRRGLFLTTTDDVVWIIESEEPKCEFVGSAVIVEGVVAGRDRLRADWIGPV
ncbi:DUF5818 domain-containing protein [Novosphingobium resinovorum]|nr:MULTISPECIES: DUF5818 domain-containing protein [Sphingomonadaceae]WJM26664.1 DUF5818 domain-containing protein [Novosphingobium resinovorum]